VTPPVTWLEHRQKGQDESPDEPVVTTILSGSPRSHRSRVMPGDGVHVRTECRARRCNRSARPRARPAPPRSPVSAPMRPVDRPHVDDVATAASMPRRRGHHVHHHERRNIAPSGGCQQARSHDLSVSHHAWILLLQRSCRIQVPAPATAPDWPHSVVLIALSAQVNTWFA